MMVTLLKSKIHNATVTSTNLQYEGSCAICPILMDAANIREYEQLHIYNINNGERFTTYAIYSETPGIIDIRGSAARLAQIGDNIIICTYGLTVDTDPYDPIKVYVDNMNKLTTKGQ